VRVPWIRVHGALYDRPVVTRLVEALRVDEHRAVGLLVTFWSGVAAHALNGFVRDYPDAQLEKWARWRGKRGAFAKWVREQHMDADGRVPEWNDYAGKLEVIRDRDRTRKAERQRNSSGNPAEGERNSTPTRANETKRDETVRNTNKEPSPRSRKNPRDVEPAPTWVQELTARWLAGIGAVTHARLGKALKPVVETFGIEAVTAAMDIYASSDEGPRNGVRRVEFFANDFAHWHRIAQTPLAVDGVLTERGKRIMGAA
jgi:hypothetical protein